MTMLKVSSRRCCGLRLGRGLLVMPSTTAGWRRNEFLTLGNREARSPNRLAVDVSRHNPTSGLSALEQPVLPGAAGGRQAWTAGRGHWKRVSTPAALRQSQKKVQKKKLTIDFDRGLLHSDSPGAPL